MPLQAAPPLVVPLIPQLCQLLTTRHTSLLEPAALLLARAGPLYRKAQAMPGHLDRTSSLEVAMPRLQSLCQTGSRRSAKLAAQAICALTPSASVQAEVGRLCARLVKVLPNKDVNSPSVISVLAALSSIGRVAPTVFEGHVKQVGAQLLLPLHMLLMLMHGCTALLHDCMRAATREVLECRRLHQPCKLCAWPAGHASCQHGW